MNRRARIRSRVFAVIAVVCLAVAAVVVDSQYRAAQASVRASRATLARSRATEKVAEDLLTELRGETYGARYHAAVDHAALAGEQQQMERIAAEMRRIAAADKQLKTQLSSSVIARTLLAAAASTVDTCLAAEQHATASIAHGDQAGALVALNAGSSACATALAAAHGARFPYDFPDPFVLPVADGYLAYSTNANGGSVQVLRSNDLVAWTLVGDALQTVPSWAVPGFTWAPALLHLPAAPKTAATPARADEYVLYYTVHEAATGAQCITSAVAPGPLGPFVDDSTGPLVCDRPDGGSIDPSPFVDRDGTVWLQWKRERAIRPSAIVSQRLGFDGRSLVGAPVDLLTADRSWEHGVVEAPAMLDAGGRHWLFVSGGVWNERSYSEGVTSCAGPAGPCDPNVTLLITTSGSVVAPGGGSVFRATDGTVWLAYHAYTDPFVGWPYSRTLRLAQLHVTSRGVAVSP
jgi:hypothetical protein